LISPSVELTLPLPGPAAGFTVSVNRCTLNVAVTVFVALIVTVHVAPETPLHPLQLPNVHPLAGAAVSVTTVPLS
jgi:hypothetical protein